MKLQLKNNAANFVFPKIWASLHRNTPCLFLVVWGLYSWRRLTLFIIGAPSYGPELKELLSERITCFKRAQKAFKPQVQCSAVNSIHSFSQSVKQSGQSANKRKNLIFSWTELPQPFLFVCKFVNVVVYYSISFSTPVRFKPFLLSFTRLGKALIEILTKIFSVFLFCCFRFGRKKYLIYFMILAAIVSVGTVLFTMYVWSW